MTISYDNPWTYKELLFDSGDISEYYGFVYMIENLTTNKKYIGRKVFWSYRKKPNERKRQKIESDWKRYYGSCPELKEDLKLYGKDNFKRTILSLHTSKKDTNYEETRQLFKHDVLTEKNENGDPKFYNQNVLGRYYRKDYFQY
jgi:hypothetical protein